MAKPAVKKKKGRSISALYKVSGDTLTRSGLECPKCGKGVFLAKHKGRTYCGKCHYTEFTKSS